MTATTASQFPASRPHLGGIESLRAYAALAVIVFHVIHLAPFDPPQSLMALKWHLGRGVPLFFAVSAFSLAYGYFGRLGSGAEQREFYLRRVFRIAPLYYLAIFFQLALNYPPLWALSHPVEMALNLSFLFGLSPNHVEGIALASWSIGVEMLFYAALPLVLFLVRGVWSAALFTALSSAAAIAYFVVLSGTPGVPPAFIQHGFVFNLPYFAFGLLAFYVWKVASPRAFWPVLAGAVLGVWGLLWLAGAHGAFVATPLGSAVYQTLWGAPLGLLCLALAWRDRAPVSWPATRFLGKISFSLYLAHPHVLAMLTAGGVYARIQTTPGGPGAGFALACAVTLIVLVPISWGLYRLVEAPGMSLGRLAASRLRPAAAS